MSAAAEVMYGLFRYTNPDAASEFVAGRSLRCVAGIHFLPRNLIAILYFAVFIFVFLG
jgi:hypothetical protein